MGSQYRMQVGKMWQNILIFVPGEPILRALKQIFQEKRTKVYKARHGKLQRCQTRRSDVQLTVETMQTYDL